MTYRNRITEFLHEETGSVTIETMLILPALFWCYMGAFVFFDAFQTDSRNVKVTYTIADILSREVNEPITPELLDSVFTIQGNLLGSDALRRLRVSVIRYQASNDTYRVVWSQTRGGGPVLTNAGLGRLRQKHLPVMYDGEVGIVVETSNEYAPIFNVGLGALKIDEIMIIPPRFAPTLCWSNSNNGPWTLNNQVC